MTEQRAGTSIITFPKRCAGCLTCELRCSLRFRKSFLLDGSAIKVRRTGNGDYRLSFTDQCDGCGICARYCLYGAIVRTRGN